ncbi:MAG TPA: DUF1569 domain-containing protein [Vicinamibacterales bacterium]|nr:DUF1569 domain-containing protein [Vicinamibacterales bacterium]
MQALWQADVRGDLAGRVARLHPATPARWGRFTPARMLAHVNDSLRMALGELAVAPKAGPLRYPPLRTLAVYVLPFPRNVPTAPELLARGEAASWDAERAAFPALLERFAAGDPASWPPHPIFGRLSRHAWGVLAYRHIDHHLRQFGV